jgi:endoglucanase Acf2
MVLGLFTDITETEEEESRQLQARLQSVEMAQKVIDKQMMVAQQIAYLLGETTAETKVTLNQIKRRILDEEDVE